jgi:hypothetical protein
MRAWIFATCLTFAAPPPAATKSPPRGQVAPTTTEEQTKDDEEGTEDDTEEMDQSEVSEHPVKPMADETQQTTAPGQVHSVVRGDTLWDLSQHYLGSPWYWPKVWSYNPEIANPHWIYPGNRVRFFPTGEDAPSQVDVAVEQGAQMSDDSEDVSSADSISLEHESEVRVSGKIGYIPKRAIRIPHQGFFTAKQLQQAGVIDSSFAETMMLSYPDTVYLRFPKATPVKIGERYIVFRTAAELVHPITHRRFGYLTHVLGTVRVTRAASGELVTAQLNPDTWDEVHRGDLIGPAGEQLSDLIEPRPNDRHLKGYVVGVLVPYLTALGEHNVIIVDRGHGDGVQVGQTFTVIRQQDPNAPEAFLNPARVQNGRFPVEDVGTCMAIEVKDIATMCLVTRSLREIVHGDRVEMRPTSGTEPRAALP